MKQLEKYIVTVCGRPRNVMYVHTVSDVNHACNLLRYSINTSDNRIVAFDTERDTYDPHRIRVISVATSDLCVVISFTSKNAPGDPRDSRHRRVMPKALVRLLMEGSAIRLCIAGDQELYHLTNDFVQSDGNEIRVTNMTDLQIIERLKTHTTNRTSLANLAKKYLDAKVSKAQQRSNWKTIPLREVQIKYSSLDSIYCIELARVMLDT